LPGIGFAVGMERLVLLINQQNGTMPKQTTDIFVAALGDDAARKGFELVHGLRAIGIRAGMDHGGRSLKSQMKQAGRLNASFVLILGEEELNQQEAPLRNMASGEQKSISLTGDMANICQAIQHEIS